MRIIVDAMGGDNAPLAPVMGAIQANKEYGVDVVLVGRGEEILKVLEENGIKTLPAGVEMVHASEVVEMCDDPAKAYRRKKDSSMTVGLTMVKNGEGDAFVCAGSTGALLSGATLVTKRIKGIRRAALAPAIPTGNGVERLDRLVRGGVLPVAHKLRLRGSNATADVVVRHVVVVARDAYRGIGVTGLRPARLHERVDPNVRERGESRRGLQDMRSLSARAANFY